MSKKQVSTLAIVLAVVAIGVVAFALSTKQSEPAVNQPVADNSGNEEAVVPDKEIMLIGTDKVNGYEYYVKAGDIQMKKNDSDSWHSITQTGMVNNASISHDSTKILFTMEILASGEIYSNDQGKNLKISDPVNKLFALDTKSKEITDLELAVEDWGWIPKKLDFYYEPVSLKEFYGSGKFYGDGVLLKRSVDGLNEQILIQNIAYISVPYKFSANGKYLAFVTFKKSHPIKLNIVNINTLEINKNNIELVALDGGLGSGAPLPIPNYYWDSEGQMLYTAFVPFTVASAGIFSESLEVWRMSVSDTPTEQLVSGLKANTTGFGDEYPKFLDNFTQVVYRDSESSLKKINLEVKK